MIETDRPHDVIIVSGKQGSGKTTLITNLVRLLQNTLKGFRAMPINFADPLYEIHDFARGTLREAGISPPYPDTKDGNLLQMLGTEWGRNRIYPDVWVDVLKGRIAKKLEMARGDGLNYIFLIGDCRFLNELTAFPGAFKIRLECAPEIRKARVSMWRENQSHPSEIGLDDCPVLFNKVYDTGEIPEGYLAQITLAEFLAHKEKANAPVNDV